MRAFARTYCKKPGAKWPIEAKNTFSGNGAPNFPLQKRTEDHMTDGPAKNPDADVWVVITAYREATRLARVLHGVCQRYRNVVVVDDGSPDETSAVALRYPVWVLRHALNCGQGAALQTGIDFALRKDAAIVVTFDGDGQHDADEIPGLVEPIRRGETDVVLGSRFLGQAIGLPKERWLVLKLGVIFT